MRERRKCCAARPWEEGRRAVSKMRRAISVKIVVEDRKRYGDMREVEDRQLVRGELMMSRSSTAASEVRHVTSCIPSI